MEFKISSPSSKEDIADAMRRVHGDDFERDYGRTISQEMDNPSIFGLTASLDGELIGSIIVHRKPNVFYGLGIHEPYRRKGYGAALINAAIQEIEVQAPQSTIYTAIALGGVLASRGYISRGFRLLHPDVIPGHLLLHRKYPLPVDRVTSLDEAMAEVALVAGRVARGG